MSGIFTKDIAVLDVTSRVVSAIVGTKKAQSVFGIKSIIEESHAGFENGEWFDIDDTLRASKTALTNAMRTAKSRTKRLFVGVPTEFLAVVTKDIVVKLDRNRRISDADIDYLMKKGETFDTDKYVTINTSAIYFSIDKVDNLYHDIRGLSGSRIEACVSYILCEKSFVDTFDKVCEDMGFCQIQYIASNWAEGLALFEKEQRNDNFILVDIGYLSSSVTIGRGDGVLNMKSFSLGCGHISADIYEALGVSFELANEARELVDLNLNYPESDVLVADSENVVYANETCEIVKARLDIFADIITDILKEIEVDYPAYLPIHLTGEGVAEMRGAKKYISESLDKNVEIVAPKLPGFSKPSDSSKISLLIVAETLSKNNFRDIMDRVTRGGKK